MNDRTTRIDEAIAKRELKPSFRDYPRLLTFVFSNAFVISSLFLALSVARPLLAPAVAALWKGFVDQVSSLVPGMRLGAGLLFSITGYVLVRALQNVLRNMTTLNGEDAFLLDRVQQNRFAEYIATKMYGKVSRLPTEYFEAPELYDRAERAFSYAGDSMRREVVVNVYAVIAGVVGSIAIIAALLLYHPLLSLMALVAPIPTLYSQLVGAKITHAFKRDTSSDRRRLEYYEELVRKGATRELKVMDAGEFIMEKWERIAEGYLKEEIRTRYRTEAIGLVGLAVNNSVTIGSSVLAIWLLSTGGLSLGAVGAVLALSGELTSIASSVFSGIGKLISNRREVSELFEFLDLPEEADESEAAPPSEELVELRAEGIRYRYPLTDRYVLDGIDFTLRRGDTVAFVGENGAGKTTFVKVLLGLVGPSAGRLTYNGVEVSDLRAADYHRLIGAVFQDYGHYRGLSVGENVRLSDTDSGEAVEPALAAAGFDAQPAEAMLGRDLEGFELSGGEWQKLAIARGLYRNRSFLVLDEPTASLDPFSEEQIFRRFLSMTEGRTSIIVTHRIGSAALASRVVVFDGGVIVEEGTHESLMASGGKYAEMFAAQAQWYRR